MLRTAYSALAPKIIVAVSLTMSLPIGLDALAADDAAKPEAGPPQATVVASAPAATEVPATPITLPTSGPVFDVASPATPSSDAATSLRVQPAPAFALATEILERLRREKVSGGEREDRDAAIKFYEARQGEPLWVTPAGLTKSATALLAFIATADDWGLSASAFKLPEAKMPTSTDVARADLADAEVLLTTAALKYARHARGGRMDPSQLSKAIDRKAQLVAPGTVLADLAKSDAPDASLRRYHPTNPQFEKLRQKFLAAKAGQNVFDADAVALASDQSDDATGKASHKKKAVQVAQPPSPAIMQKRLLANMEQWRWMPDMGDTYINDNIPEFMVRVMRDGKLVHSERIVTGKPDTPTPIFSEDMQTVVFQPFWNVPESIKWKELQPQLMRNGGALGRAGLRAAYNGRDVDPAEVDWGNADMRQFHIYQPPGGANALGQVKFLFPNKHDVYMHDTPSKSLFNQSSRAYSHGCMRVRDPLKFAEVILSADKGWDMKRIVELANRGPQNNEIRLTKRVPVHVTYFTTVVDDDGKLKTFTDLYGHEQKIHLGLEGKTNMIAQLREERYVPPRRDRLAQQQKPADVADWIKKVLNF
jgi:L,D-transpeptidase YcbB